MYAKTMFDDIVHDIGSTTVIQGTTWSGSIETPWLNDALKSLTDALLDDNNNTISKDVRKAFMKDFTDFCASQQIEFDRNNREQAAAVIIGQLRLASQMPKAFGAASIFAKGLWYRSTGVVKGESWLRNNDITKTGGKLATVIKVCQEETHGESNKDAPSS